MGSAQRRHALPLVGLFLVTACDAGGLPCRKACSKLASCVGANGDAGIVYRKTATESEVEPGQFTCSLSSDCTPKEACLADCVDQSTCAAITGKDAKGALALRLCRAKCELQRRDGGSGPGSDGGNPLICTPSCAGKQCGDDGCGGSCGLCVFPSTCSASGKCSCTPSCTAGRSCATCPDGLSCGSSGLCEASATGCGNTPYQGCCSGTTLKYCESGQLRTVDCSSSPSCGWSSSIGYNCGTSGGSDPTGQYPKTCR